MNFEKLLLTINLEECIDSMLFDENTVIAEYKEDDIYLSIIVDGKINFDYKGINYTSAKKYTDEIRNLIKNNGIFSDITLHEYNQFMIVGSYNNNEIKLSLDADISKMDYETLKNEFRELAKAIRREYK